MIRFPRVTCKRRECFEAESGEDFFSIEKKKNNVKPPHLAGILGRAATASTDAESLTPSPNKRLLLLCGSDGGREG